MATCCWGNKCLFLRSQCHLVVTQPDTFHPAMNCPGLRQASHAVVLNLQSTITTTACTGEKRKINLYFSLFLHSLSLWNSFSASKTSNIFKANKYFSCLDVDGIVLLHFILQPPSNYLVQSILSGFFPYNKVTWNLASNIPNKDLHWPYSTEFLSLCDALPCNLRKAVHLLYTHHPLYR